MKLRYQWASAFALAVFISSQVTTLGITNGVVFISSRAGQDTGNSSEFVTDERGPGMVTPGDVAMGALLSDHGYSCRLLLDKLLSGAAQVWLTAPPDPYAFLLPLDTNMAPALIIISGSSAGADVPPRNTNGIPVMMGEHTDLADRSNPGAIYMYSGGGQSTDPNGTAVSTSPSKYLKAVNTSHPIMQGIPLDAQGRVKIFRDPYPEENAHLPFDDPSISNNPKQNYEYRWCAIPAANAAPGTTVLGVLDGQETLAVFAVTDVGGVLAFNPNLGYADTNQARLVHIFTNENGSGGARRVFNALTDLGRILFVRAAKWAMGETLEPYQGLGLIRVSKLGSQQIQLEWDGTPTRLYKILGTRNLAGPSDQSNWQTVAQDIAVSNGVASVKFDVSGAVQYAFLRVAPMQ